MNNDLLPSKCLNTLKIFYEDEEMQALKLLFTRVLKQNSLNCILYLILLYLDLLLNFNTLFCTGDKICKNSFTKSMFDMEILWLYIYNEI